jgi:hypothetical protein
MTDRTAYFPKAFARALRRFRLRPLDRLLALVAILVTAYALLAPFFVVRYPPMTDLPMHAAITSAFRHWRDPAWHFQDQFELQLFAAPTLTLYVLGALLAVVLPITWAVKLATAASLSLLPIGLAVYCRGLHKNPTMGVAAAFFAWGTFTHWGFISYLAGLGLTLMGVGLTFMVLERPTRTRTVLLAVVTVMLFFTHVSELPPCLVAVAIVTIAMAPIAPSIRPVLVAVLPSIGLFAGWWIVRPRSLTGEITMTLDPSRVARIPDWLFRGFHVTTEVSLLSTMVGILVAVSVYSVLISAYAARVRGLPRRSRRARRASVAALAIVGMFLCLYFVMPLSIGVWALVYPREITAATLFALGALPGLPRSPSLRAPALAALLVGVTMATRFVAARYAAFDVLTKDFAAIIEELPPAPKLGYIMQDRSGAEGSTLPLLHLPAWVQAERGGWLSFHFATWQATPIRFRTTPPMDVPPSTPDGFETHPALFDVATRGKYFDWFLVRAPQSPEARFAVDPKIHLVDHRGWWWLYHRQ